MVLSDDTPGARCTNISTLPDVRSSTLRILIFLFAGLYDGVAYTGHRFPVRNFLNGKCLVVYLFYFGAHAYRTATFTVVVFGYIDTASRLEVGVQLEFFVVQIADGSIAQLIEVMW